VKEDPVDSNLYSDARLARKLPFPNPKVLNHVTSMQTGHGWTVSNALSSALNDTSVFALGTQSATFTCKTDTTAATLTKTGLALDISASKQLRLLLRIDGVENISGCTLYVSSDTMVANFGVLKIQNQTPDLAVRWIKEGEWKWVTLNWADAAITGAPNLAAIDSLRIRATGLSGSSFTVHLQAVQVIERKNFASGGVVCFTYDDSYSSQYAIAAKRLDLYGYAGTAYTIVENVQKGNAGNALYLTTAQLKSMRDYSGWEISPHAWSVANHNRGYAPSAAPVVYVGQHNAVRPDELDADLGRMRDWLSDNGLSDGYAGMAYPLGKFSTAVAAQMSYRLSYARAMTSSANAFETVPPADPYALRSAVMDNSSVLATMTGWVDACAANGSLLIFCIHEIVTPATTTTQVTQANHDGLVDYVAGKAGIRVMTLGNVMQSLATQT
jgi:hypothetical protein